MVNQAKHDHFRKILRAFNIVDNSIIAARHDPSYRPSVRLGPLLDYINKISMNCVSPDQAVAINKSLVSGKVRNPRFGTKGWLIAYINTVFVLQCYIYQ